MSYIFIIIIVAMNFSYSQTQESIYDQINLAKSYIEAGLEEDAIIVYKNLLSFKKEILGKNNIELVNILFSISDLYLMQNNIDSAKVYLQKSLNIQHYNFLIRQKNYISTYLKLKNIYSLNNDTTKIEKIDSLLKILYSIDNDSTYIIRDSIFTYPDIITFKSNHIDSTSLVSEYTTNDKAIDLFNTGISYLNKGIYSESISAFDQGLKLNASVINLDYLLNISYGDSSQNKNFLSALNDIALFDSTITTYNLFSAVVSGNLNKPEEEIILYLKSYIEIHPEDIKGFLYLGNVYFKSQEYIDAMHYYHRLLLIRPNHIEANLNFSKCLIELEDYPSAIDKLYIIENKDSNNFYLKYYLGYCFYKLNDYKKAIDQFTQALLLDSKDADTYYYLGRSYLVLQKKKQALESLIMSIQYNPYNGYAHFELGKIYESVLKINLALEEYRLADKYINDHDLNYAYGILLYKEQLYNRALNPLREFIIYDSENKEILEILGDIFIRENRFPEAIDTYNRLIEQAPDDERYYQNLALSYYELNNYSMAKVYYEKILIFNEENEDILLKLGSISNLLYKYGDAQKYLLESISCGYTSKDILFELGLAYGGQNKYLQALIVLKEALTYSPDDPILHYQVGIIYKEMNIYDLAIQELIIYIQTITNDPVVYRLIGSCYRNLNNYKDAIIYYKKANNLYKSEDTSTLYNLGYSYLKIEDFQNAAKYFKFVLRINHDHAKAHDDLIRVYSQLNKLREVKKECDILFMLERNLYSTNEYCSY